ncbi:coiled-coil domain-containing protein 66 [Anarrhichthys ocellatus]|uniref:coiled-coil domain-containing protein 66 n=1 Tax=Anarrhichthys ocellatus TaxID=433405 RepID=UPI0012EDEC4A|nr:coiled-coil domain-containing protein 66 [Anarrhichthys ocellatus]
MNLGDGLLFELENGKPKLILLSRGVEKNPAKLSFRPRAANVLSSRQPSCVEEVQREQRPARQQQSGRHKETKSKAGGAAASFTSNTTTTGGRSSTLTSSKTQEHHKGLSVKVMAKVKSDRHKHGATVGSLRTDGKTGRPQNSGTRAAGKEGLTGLEDSVVCVTNEQLQKILHTVQTCSVGPHPPEDHQTQVNQTDLKEAGSSMNGGEGGEMKEEDRGGGTDTSGRSQDKDNRLSGCPFSWLEERQSESRAAIDAKKALWRRELDEQVALKQQCSAPGRLQAEEDTESVFSVQSSVSHRDQHAAIRSSLRLGEVTPMEELLSAERREEQRRRWLEELDQQREETSERRRREKLLQSQMVDHELWATHFDSLRRPPVQTAAPSAPPPSAPPPAPSIVSERGEWEPSSSLSLVWEAASSCGAESVGRASVDTTSGHPTRASHLRTMTALLDPAQIEERDRRRLKQLELQRAIEAQVEERRLQRRREEARRREELEEEERRLALEREMLERRYKQDTVKEKQKLKNQAEQQKTTHNNDGGRQQETLETSATRQSECLEEEVNSSSAAAQTGNSTMTATNTVTANTSTTIGNGSIHTEPSVFLKHCLHARMCFHSSVSSSSNSIYSDPPVPCSSSSIYSDPPVPCSSSSIYSDPPVPVSSRPSHRFVPASERYPAPLQRYRQESRQRRQAELLALQERTCLSRTDPPPPPPPPPQHEEPRLCSNPSQTRTSPTMRVENVSRGLGILAAVNTERGRSPQRAPSSSTPPPPPPEFIPYVRTDEVFNMDPLEPADTPPTRTHTPPQSSASPPAAPSHRLLHSELLRNTQTHRQQEILRGLAQLRQGLLQKQRELETDLNPLLKRHDNEHRPPTATHRK